MSWKRRQAARARAAELRQAAQLVEAMEEAAEAAVAEQAARNLTMTSAPEDAVYLPKLSRTGGEEVIVWHQPSGKYLPLWTARSLDKAAINDMAYPSAPPGEEPHLRAMGLDPGQVRNGADCGDEEQRRDAGSLKMAKAVIARDQEPEPEEPADEEPEDEDEEPEEEAAAKILAAVQRLDERLSELERTRAERQTLDAELEALELKPALN